MLSIYADQFLLAWFVK